MSRMKKMVKTKQKLRRPKDPEIPRVLRKSRVAADPSLGEQSSQVSETKELTEVQTKHVALVSKVLGMATGAGGNYRVAQRTLAQFNAILMGETDVRTALFMLAELHPSNMLEAMLVTQMVGVHEKALAFLKTSTNDDYGEFRDRNVSRATRLMRLFSEQLALLERLRGKSSQQRVTVEHVHVNAGGQAIVGVVAPPGGVGKKKNGRMTP